MSPVVEPFNSAILCIGMVAAVFAMAWLSSKQAKTCERLGELKASQRWFEAVRDVLKDHRSDDAAACLYALMMRVAANGHGDVTVVEDAHPGPSVETV